MREIIPPQVGWEELPIGEIKLDPKSRDDIPQILLGLQHIDVTPALPKAQTRRPISIRPDHRQFIPPRGVGRRFQPLPHMPALA